MAMLNESDFEWSYSSEADEYEPPRPADEPCEEAPVEGGWHVRSLVSGKCIFCKREVET